LVNDPGAAITTDTERLARGAAILAFPEAQFAAEKLGDMIDALKLRFCKKNSSESDRTFQNYDFFDDR
jgi:hypothetical protein